MEASAWSTRWWRVAVAALAGFLVLFLLTRSHNHDEAEDSVTYIAEVTSGATPTANHILFNPINRGAYLLARSFGYRGNAETPMEVVNVLAAVLALGILLRLLRRLDVKPAFAIGGVVAAGLAYGFWWYAGEAETYTLPIPVILLALERAATCAVEPRPRNSIVLGLLCSLVILIHQQHALVAIAAFIGIARIGWSTNRMARTATHLALLTGVVCASTLAVYVSCAVAVGGARTGGQIARWCLGLASHGLWSPLTLWSPLKSVVGFGRAIVGLQMLFRFDAFARFMHRLFPTKILLEESFLVRDAPKALAIAYAALLAIVIATGALLVWRSVKPGETRDETPWARAFHSIALGTFILYVVFNTIWEPQNLEFWIAPVTILPALLVPALQRLSARRPSIGKVGAGYVVALGLSNLVGCVLPQLEPGHSYWPEMNRPIIEQAREGDLVLSNGGYMSVGCLRADTAADVVEVAGLEPDQLLALLASHRGRKVFISSWIADPLPEVVVTRMVRRRDDLAALLRARGSWDEVGRSESQTVYLLR
jgi:hypothetical protein